MYHFEVKSPTSLTEALSIMDQYGKDIEPLAGGTDVLIMVRNNLGKWGKVPMMLNIQSIPEMDFIIETSDTIEIGPSITHTDVLQNSIIKEHIPALIKAVEYIIAPLTIKGRRSITTPINNASINFLPPLYLIFTTFLVV